MIQLSNVSKTYQRKGESFHALQDISLTIEDGEIFGIIGKSGAGKSTLIRLINRLEEVSTGDIWIDNIHLETLRRKELQQLRQSIGMIFQHFNLLWSRTVAENISFPLEIAKVPKDVRTARIQELISLVGLTGKEDAYPAELSGGQKQRVGIARALANNPKILLSDEATSALDPKTTQDILQLLKQIQKKTGITVVLITHEMDVVKSICDRIAVIDHGRIVEMGPTRDIIQAPQHGVTQQLLADSILPNKWEEGGIEG
ncbi:methionine ABC transporter ATP-binding protein [Rubeoparvulum massiliense]|uniref:methionine ABC transporter ATP-binding protein n=1 Tax=Rubeoparvulum massiliense TaxID=1631346 RepID=UPI00069E7067